MMYGYAMVDGIYGDLNFYGGWSWLNTFPNRDRQWPAVQYQGF